MLDPVVEFPAAFNHDDRVRPGSGIAFLWPRGVTDDGYVAGLDAAGHGQRSRRDNEAIAADRGVLEAVGAMLGHEPF